MAAVPRAEPGQRQKTGAPFGSPMRVAMARKLGTYILLQLLGLQQGPRLQKKQLGCKLVPVSDSSVVGGSFTCYVAIAPLFSLFLIACCKVFTPHIATMTRAELTQIQDP